MNRIKDQNKWDGEMSFNVTLATNKDKIVIRKYFNNAKLAKFKT